MILDWLILAFIFFVPGYLIFHVLNRDKLSISLLELIIIYTVTSVTISGWISIFLADIGYFSLPSLLSILSAVCLVSALFLVLKRRRSLRSIVSFPLSQKLNRKNLFIIGILIISLSLFFKPGDYVTCHLDDTPIVSHATHVATSGNIVAHDPIFQEVTEKDLFYSMRSGRYYKGLQFPKFGFYIDKGIEDVSFQYLDFYPILLAISFATLGSKFFLYLTPIIALLSIIALYTIIRILFSWKIAVISAFLLSINMSQIYFSRYPGTEIFNQLLIFSAVISIYLLMKYRSAFFAFFTSIIFGTLLLVRVDSIGLGLVMIFIIMTVTHLKFNVRTIYLLLGTFFLFNIFSSLHIYYFDKSYVYDQFTVLLSRIGLAVPGGLAIEYILLIYMAPSLLVLIFYLFFTRIDVTDFIRRLALSFDHKAIRLSISFLIAISFLALYVIQYSFSGGVIGNRQTLLIIQWFLTPIGLLFAVAGLILIINDLWIKTRCSARYVSLIAYLLIVIPNMVAFIFITLFNQPLFPWAFRRYVPVLFPFLIVCVAYSIEKIVTFTSRFHFKKENYLHKILYIGLIAILCIPMVEMDIDSGILVHKDFDGLIDQTEEFASYFDENSIILFYDVNFYSGIAVPLKYVYQKDTILIPTLKVNNDFIDQVDYWKNQGKHVYLVQIIHTPELYEWPLNKRISSFVNYTINVPGMTKVRQPPIGSQPYGEIHTFEAVLYVYEIE
ncbi:hypothetical protein ACFLQ6_03815 [Thermoproteota archaeon]